MISQYKLENFNPNFWHFIGIEDKQMEYEIWIQKKYYIYLRFENKDIMI